MSESEPEEADPNKRLYSEIDGIDDTTQLVELENYVKRRRRELDEKQTLTGIRERLSDEKCGHYCGFECLPDLPHLLAPLSVGMRRHGQRGDYSEPEISGVEWPKDEEPWWVDAFECTCKPEDDDAGCVDIQTEWESGDWDDPQTAYGTVEHYLYLPLLQLPLPFDEPCTVISQDDLDSGVDPWVITHDDRGIVKYERGDDNRQILTDQEVQDLFTGPDLFILPPRY